jgi:hypothetical protein
MSNEKLQITWAKAEITAVSIDQSQSSMHVGAYCSCARLNGHTVDILSFVNAL